MADYARLLELLRQAEVFQQQADALEELEQQIRDNEMILSVIGQFKRGKSALINAMLGQPLLPVAITPLTAVATEIRQGDQPRAQVCFRDGSCRDIAPEELGLYCGEKDNPHNCKEVALVRLWTPVHPFGPGTVLVDTPGVGSVNRDNTSAAVDYLHHSDAMVFLLSVDSPLSETELQFLREARQYTPNLYFAVNKADLVPPEDLEEFLQYCSGLLTEQLGRAVTLRPVSARTGAGVPELKQVLARDLRDRRAQMRSASAHRKYQLLLEQIRAVLSVAEQSAAVPARELQDKRTRMEAQRRALASYGETLALLSRHHTDQLVTELGQTLRQQLEALAPDIDAHAAQLVQSLGSLPLGDFQEAYQLQLGAYLTQQLEALNARGLALLQTGFAQVSELLTRHTTETEACLARVLREEFGVDYPLTSDHFTVSELEDFYVQVELRRMPRLYAQLRDRLTPRKTAQARFLAQCRQRTRENLECNLNNMLYNYRYKMQESLRPLNRILTQRISRVDGELVQLIALLDSRLSATRQELQARDARFRQIRALLETCTQGERSDAE